MLFFHLRSCRCSPNIAMRGRGLLNQHSVYFTLRCDVPSRRQYFSARAQVLRSCRGLPLQTRGSWLGRGALTGAAGCGAVRLLGRAALANPCGLLRRYLARPQEASRGIPEASQRHTRGIPEAYQRQTQRQTPEANPFSWKDTYVLARAHAKIKGNNFWD